MIWLMNVRLWIVFSRVACIGEYVTILTKLVWEEENIVELFVTKENLLGNYKISWY